MVATSAPILVVDDEPMLRRAVAREFRGEFVIIECDGGAAAISKLGEASDVAAIVSDLDMPPGPGGLEVLDEARHRHPAALRILMSGRAAPEDVEQAVREGLVLRFFQKPWPTGELARAVRDGLAARAAAREASPAADVESAASCDLRIMWRLCRNHGLEDRPAREVLQEAARRVLACPGRVTYPTALMVTTTHLVAAEHHRRAHASSG